MKLFIPKISTNALNIHTFKIGATINGIKKIGFKINGAPNKIGSLTPNNTGIELALPTALNSLDFAMKANINVTTRVAPVPPNVATNCWQPGVKMLAACFPAWNNSKLLAMFT